MRNGYITILIVNHLKARAILFLQTGLKKVGRVVCAYMVEERFKSLAIVTHGGVMRYLLSKLSPEKRDFWEWKVPHGQGFEFVWSSNEAFRRGDRCNLLRVVPLTENPAG